MNTDEGTDLTGERSDLIETLPKHRALFLHTVEGIDEDQARTRTTASAHAGHRLGEHRLAEDDGMIPGTRV